MNGLLRFMAPSENLKSIVIVGGGTAGWLTAGIIAAEHNANGSESDGLIDIKSNFGRVGQTSALLVWVRALGRPCVLRFKKWVFLKQT